MPFFIPKAELKDLSNEKISPQGVEMMRFSKLRSQFFLLPPDGEIITQHFPQAKTDYVTRITNYTGRFGVDMTLDKLVVTLSVSDIEKVLNSGKQYIVARFGCEEQSADFKGLTVAVCSMNPSELDNTTPLYTEGFEIDTPSEIQIWRGKERNYQARQSQLKNGDPIEFRNDFLHGVAHDIAEFRKEWYDYAITQGMTNVALYFIKFRGVGTIAYADARIDEATLSNFEVYDFGGACCPPS